MVDAPEIFERTVGPPTCEVSCAIHPRVCVRVEGERIRYEPLGSELGRRQ